MTRLWADHTVNALRRERTRAASTKFHVSTYHVVFVFHLHSATMHLSWVQFAWAALLALSVCAGAAAAPPSSAPHHVARRSFFSLECKGVYDASIFARLDRVCDDCYNLFREPQLYTLCRAKCFTTPYFKGCMESLYLYDEKEQIDQMIDFVGKR
ncbi:CHH-like protein isoform X2 [Manduca sexta]|nr:CHH-like protein isoform X2 [Manduca sexta]